MSRQRNYIMIRFLRQNKPAKDDDVLKVMKIEENSLNVIYKERTTTTPCVSMDFQKMNYKQFMMYIMRIFNLLAIDDDPIDSVQFLIPMYPSFLLKVETLKRSYNPVIELLTEACTSWPTAMQVASEEVDSESDSNTEYETGEESVSDIENVDLLAIARGDAATD